MALQIQAPEMRKAAPAKPGTAFRMVSGRKGRHESLYQTVTPDNAPCGNLPTPLLNHETSDHLLSRC
jgi:hypothetical protein